VENARKKINDILHSAIDQSEKQIAINQKDIGKHNNEEKIFRALNNISTTLGNSYSQVITDIQDAQRVSWAGTAHEVREIIATLLRTIAPDDKVKKESWYKQETNTSGPTQKQRVHYILKTRNAHSKELEVVEQITKLEDMIEDLVRATYSRASDAAHTHKSRTEVVRLLRYFEAFALDLLNIEE